ncbi:hypothetical protein GCM10010326_46660 [Streptomyces xanthochromogenes]|uniref:Uncharacterized protein n=1 Tax=Streptomyces xanthochromogenes TaxID=67384 RepID=A0ABQ3AH07_9ACTN|nr:hypothetical protein GCM10010326_46660 [Streptomyces xanthochromogenes]
MRIEPLLDAALDGDEAMAQLGVGGRAYDADTDHGERSSGDSLDDAHTTPRQSGVDPEYAHGPSPRPSVIRLSAISVPVGDL